MKRYFLLSTALLFNLYALAQNGAPTLTLDNEQIISINNIVEEIRNDTNKYRKVEKIKNKEGFNRGFFLDGELVLIKHSYKDTITEKSAEFYFQNGKLIYSQKLWLDIKTNDTLEYERYYLTNERLIAWFKFGQSVARSSVAFKKVAYKIRDYLGDLKLEYVK
jgi:hypothetical protein